ncbi:MAG: hypothetical protein ACM3Q2_10945 [Syntrophothermus sp.]
MKNLLLSFFLLTSAVSASPSVSDTLCTICISTNDDDVAAFRTIGKILNSSGFDLEDSEEALMVVTTEIMKRGWGLINPIKLALRLKAEISMTDSLTFIRLSGRYLEPVNQKAEEEEYFERYSDTIANAYPAASAGEAAWNYMMQIAGKYKNGKIRFEK